MSRRSGWGSAMEHENAVRRQALHKSLQQFTNFLLEQVAALPHPDYRRIESAYFAVGWMMGGYEGTGPFGKGLYASTRVFLVWAPWWNTSNPYMVMTTPMKMVAEGEIYDEIPEHVRPRKIVTCWTFSDAVWVLQRRKMGLWAGCT